MPEPHAAGGSPVLIDGELRVEHARAECKVSVGSPPELTD
jgi:hypothetical protein